VAILRSPTMIAFVMPEDPAGTAWDVRYAPKLIRTGMGVRRSLVLILQDESKPRLWTVKPI
jgi:hypothetical protein